MYLHTYLHTHMPIMYEVVNKYLALLSVCCDGYVIYFLLHVYLFQDAIIALQGCD